jgi:hypothetical protein
MSDGLYVQYGCGFSAPPGWLNFDASPTLRFERSPIAFFYTRNSNRFPGNVRYGDIVSGLPIEAGSCRGLYCSHVLEHLALEDCDRALEHSRQYLRPGGTFRIVLPDFEIYVQDYLTRRANGEEDAAGNFMRSASLGRERRSRGVVGILRDWLGNSAHRWMWDEKSLGARLRAHGFVDIRRAAFGDAEDPRFAEVEEATRFEDALAMQCRR